MLTTVVSDFSRVLLHPKDKTYTGTLNGLHRELQAVHGNYDAFDYFELNTELLSFYRSLKSHFSLNIFTSGSVQNHPQLQEVLLADFENIFSAEELSLSKKDSSAYLAIAQKLHRPPQEIIFIDDQRENVEAAQRAGLHTFIYTNNTLLQQDFTALFKL